VLHTNNQGLVCTEPCTYASGCFCSLHKFQVHTTQAPAMALGPYSTPTIVQSLRLHLATA